jgi:hypothetical protein
MFRLKFALLTPEQYATLNEAISAAKGYPDNDGTARYAPAVPAMSAEVTNEEQEVISPAMCVMPITAEVQELYPQTIEGVELVDSYVAGGVTEEM